MKELKRRVATGILVVLGIGGSLLIGLSPTYGAGEYTPMVPTVLEGTLEIGIKNMDFTNQAAGSVNDHLLIIPAGISVKWTNMDPLKTLNGELGLMPHGIQIGDAADNKIFMASPILTWEHNSFSHAFSKEGTYTYGCFIHPFMKGKIVVVNMQLPK